MTNQLIKYNLEMIDLSRMTTKLLRSFPYSVLDTVFRISQAEEGGNPRGTNLLFGQFFPKNG